MSAQLVEMSPAMLAELNNKRAKEGKSPLKVNADGKTVTLASGVKAGYKKATSSSGKAYLRWVIVDASANKGKGNANMKAISARRGSKSLSRKSAERAFNRYYRTRDYESPRARKAAMSRDMHYSPKDAKKVTSTTRYLRNPGKLDYPGLDAGPKKSSARGNLAALAKARAASRSPRRSGKDVRHHIKHASPAQRAKASAEGKARRAAAKALKASQKGGRNNNNNNNEDGEEQEGGRAVSLKTAVRLLRSYYNNKFERRN